MLPNVLPEDEYVAQYASHCASLLDGLVFIFYGLFDADFGRGLVVSTEHVAELNEAQRL